MDNTEGSRAIIQTFRARKNLELVVSDHQMAIILGSILGDGYVHPLGKICFEHSETQKEYLLWKYDQLKTLAYPAVSHVIRLDKRTQSQTDSWRFFLRQYFRPLRKAFYQQNKKRIPSALKPWLSPLLLAVWYMDDGYLDRQKYPLLMTESFTYHDVKLLTVMLNETFGLECLITTHNRIRISVTTSKIFFQLVEPYIHTSLKYKLP